MHLQTSELSFRFEFRVANALTLTRKLGKEYEHNCHSLDKTHNRCKLELIISHCQRDFSRLTIFIRNPKKILKKDFSYPRTRNRIRVRYDILPESKKVSARKVSHVGKYRSMLAIGQR